MKENFLAILIGIIIGIIVGSLALISKHLSDIADILAQCL